MQTLHLRGMSDQTSLLCSKRLNICQVHTYPDLALLPATRDERDQNCTQSH